MTSKEHGRPQGDSFNFQAPVALEFEGGGLAARIAAAGAAVITDTGETIVSLRLGVDPMTPFEPVLAVAGIGQTGIERISITALSAHLDSTVWRIPGDVIPARRLADLCDQAYGILAARGCRPATTAILPTVRPYFSLRPGCPVMIYSEADRWGGRAILPIGLVDSTGGPAVLAATDGVAGGAPRLEIMPLRELRNADFGEVGHREGMSVLRAWGILAGHAGQAAIDRTAGVDRLLPVGEVPGLPMIVAPLIEAQHREANETPERAAALITTPTLVGPWSGKRPDAEDRESAPAPSP